MWLFNSSVGECFIHDNNMISNMKEDKSLEVYTNFRGIYCLFLDCTQSVASWDVRWLNKECSND